MGTKDRFNFATETLDSYLARGGKITKINTGKRVGRKKTELEQSIDCTSLPKKLKTKLGV